MPFKALVDNEERVSILQSPAEWAELRKLSRGSPQSVRCIACEHPMILRGPTDKVVAHFAHRAGADCVFSGETCYHMDAKVLIAKTALEAGCEVGVEERLDCGDGIVIADTLITRPDGSRLVIEFQNSRQTAGLYVERTAKYRSLGLPVLWITWRKFAKALLEDRACLRDTEILFLDDADYAEGFRGRPPVEAFHERGFSGCSLYQWVPVASHDSPVESLQDWSQQWREVFTGYTFANAGAERVLAAVRDGRVPAKVEVMREGINTFSRTFYVSPHRLSLWVSASAFQLHCVDVSLEAALQKVYTGQPPMSAEWVQVQSEVLQVFLQESIPRWANIAKRRRQEEIRRLDAEAARRIKSLKEIARERFSVALKFAEDNLPALKPCITEALLPYLSHCFERDLDDFESLTTAEWQLFVDALERSYEFVGAIWQFIFPEAGAYYDYRRQLYREASHENQLGDAYPHCQHDRAHLVFCGYRRASGRVEYHRACSECGRIGKIIRGMSPAQKASIPIFDKDRVSDVTLHLEPAEWARCPADPKRRVGFIPPRCSCGDRPFVRCWHSPNRLPSTSDDAVASG